MGLALSWLLCGVAIADGVDESRTSVGVSFVAAADGAVADAAGLPGVHVEVAHWHGLVALVGEAGHVRDGDSRGGSWFGAGVRLGIGDARLDHGPQWFRVIGWTQVGMAHERWQLRDSGSLARNHVHAGVGLTAFGGRQTREVPVAAQLWFRVQRADTAGSDMDDVPDRINMILGLGLLVAL